MTLMIHVMMHRDRPASLHSDELARLIKERIKRESVFSGISKIYFVGLVDVVNSTVNTARISKRVVIGGDLYQIVKSLKIYEFGLLGFKVQLSSVCCNPTSFQA